MQYYLSYKGKKIGDKMDHEYAEGLLTQMSACFQNLEIVEAVAANHREDIVLQPSDRTEELARRWVNPA